MTQDATLTSPSLAFRELPLTKRTALCERIATSYPNTVPVIVLSHDPTLPLAKWRYLVPETHRMAMVYYEVQKHSLQQLGASEGLFFMVSDAYHKMLSVPASQAIGEVYTRYRDVDGFLYLTVMRENTFG